MRTSVPDVDAASHVVTSATRRRVLAAIAATVLAPLLGPHGHAQQREVGPIERVNLITRPAVVYLEMAWKGRVRDRRDGLLWFKDSIELNGACSGSIVDPDGFVLTAGHCVDPGINGIASSFYEEVVNRAIESGEVDPSEADTFYQEVAGNSDVEDASGDPVSASVVVYRGTVESDERSGKAYEAEVLDYSTLTDTDVALLKIDGAGLPTIEISNETDVGVGTPIVAIGYPGSVAEIIDPTLEPSVKEGTVSAKRTIGGFPRYEMSAASTQGMSGGPVTDLDGRVLAVVSSAPASERQSFNFVAPISGAEKMLRDSGVRNELAPIDRPYREGLEQLFEGDFAAAKTSFDRVLTDDPKHQQAYELRAEAAKRENGASGGGFPVWIIVPVVVLGAGVFAFSRRRRGVLAPVPAPEPLGPASATPASATPASAPPAGGGLVCPHCGNVAQRAVAFCTKCGRSMTAEPVATASAASTSRSWLARNRWAAPAGIGAVVLALLVVIVATRGPDQGGEPGRTAGLLGGSQTAAPRSDAPSIAGAWDSNFGPVTLEHDALDGDQPVKVKGSWEQGEGKHGEITGGTFDPAERTLEISYVETWTDVEGTASFELSEDGTSLTGTYEQPGAKGEWLLARLSEAAS